MKKIILGIVILGSLSVSAFASDSTSPSFDEVVYGDKVVTKEVPAGFGTLKLLQVIDNEEVRPTYDQLKQIGSVSVSVQKLPAASSRTSKITKYTFVAHQRTGMFSSRVAAKFSVETHISFDIADDSPTFYKVGKIETIE